MQVVCIRLRDPTTFTVPPFWDFGHFLATLRQNGSIPFEVSPAFGLGQNSGLALVDLVADLAQQLLHQARPTVIVGVDDKDEIPKKMRPAYLMLAQLVCKVCCPAIVDQRTGVERIDAERVDGFLAPLAMQELERQDTVAGYVQPPVLLVDPDAGFISMKGRACQKMLSSGRYIRDSLVVQGSTFRRRTYPMQHQDSRPGLFKFWLESVN